MGIPQYHGLRFLPQRFSYRRQRNPCTHKPGGKGVSQIMKMEIPHSGPFVGPLKIVARILNRYSIFISSDMLRVCPEGRRQPIKRGRGFREIRRMISCADYKRRQPFKKSLSEPWSLNWRRPIFGTRRRRAPSRKGNYRVSLGLFIDRPAPTFSHDPTRRELDTFETKIFWYCQVK